ncbi:MAG: flagellar hook-length control protein FliK [Phycisphaerales bacterium]|nr:flagellar hook-length control protein FliK [Phycisphaerales bacterium]MCB9857042.1 flagellar hook-length control protein FliK [Phycisphaerales bacterium]MCB9861831.1 flagellar hook-length control protein FliK [Phycisphaerales bacterium]
MGPASIAAEIFRPQATDLLAAQSRKTAADDNRFNDYLDEAQGADDARKAEDVKKRDDASKSDAPSKDDDQTADADEAASAAAATQSVVVQVVTVDIPTESIEADAQATTSAVDAAAVAQASDSDAGARSDSAEIDATPIALQTDIDTDAVESDRPNVNVARTVEIPVDDANRVANTESKASLALKEAASQPVETAVVPEDVSVETDPAAKDARTTEVRGVRPTDKTDVGSKDSYTRAAIGKANESHEPIVPHETIQQRKVRDAVEARRVEPANAAANRPEPKKTDRNESGPGGSQSGKAAQAVSRSETATANAGKSGAFASRLASASATLDKSGATTDAASIKSGVGDSAAVSALRFLIAGQSNSGQSASQSVNAGGTAAGSAPSSALTAPSGSANTIVSDLLTGGADKSGGVDGMVRELNASGVPGRYQATLRLDPPSMGTVRIQLNLQQEGLSIQVDTQSKHVSKLIESRLEDLREALSAHGIRVERADVVTKSPANAETSDRHENSQHHFDQSSADGADYQMPRDAQDRNHSAWAGTTWQNTGESSDSPIRDIQQDTTQVTADRDWGANGFAPGAVDLVA